MPLYEMHWMSKDAALKAMTERPEDREPPARELIESFGGRMHLYRFMLGGSDGRAMRRARSGSRRRAVRHARTRAARNTAAP